MKTKLLSLLLALATFTSQAQTFINLGSSANAGDGDSLRAAGIIINTNFYSIFANLLSSSNAIYAGETTRNAAVSNAVASLLVANDTTTSNGLYSAETTRNAAVSNALVSFAMTLSNTLYTTETTRNAAVSNAVVALIGAAGTNYVNLNGSHIINTNTFDSLEVTYNANTNIVIDWGATNVVNLSPSNTFTITMTSTPPTGMKREIDVLLINTNSANGYFPTNDANGGSVYLLPAPSTNRFKFNWRGGRFWISSAQAPEIGTNSYMRTRTGVRRTFIIDASYILTNGLTQGAIPTTYVSPYSSSNAMANSALYFDSADAATNAVFSLTLPPEYDRNDITLVPVWAATNGSGNVVWQFATTYMDNTESFNQAYGNNANSTDTLVTANGFHTGPAVTPAYGNTAATVLGNVCVRVRRSRDVSGDTLDAGVFLLRVLLQYTESNTEPSALP